MPNIDLRYAPLLRFIETEEGLGDLWSEGFFSRRTLNGNSISEMDLELKHLNVLIGANGVGKSNFISFFRFMNKLVQKDLQFFVAQQGGANRFLYFGSQVTNAVWSKPWRVD